MTPPVAFDLTRLFLGPVIPTPRGIDRVDLGYATHFLERWPGDCLATLPTPFGVRAVEREAALRICKSVASIWGEGTPPGDDPAFHFVKENLADERKTAMWLQRRSANVRRTVFGLLRALGHSGGLPGRSAVRAVPQGAVYLNTGHLGLSYEWMLSWLRAREDVKPIFMLHDTIPIDHPQFVAPIARRMHARMLTLTARFARGMIVTTEAVRHTVTSEIERRGRSDLSIVAARLPVAADFLVPEIPDPELSRHRYFVVCGSIEPRKNHSPLLDVLRHLDDEAGAEAPRLVVVGTPWRRSAAVINTVLDSPGLRENVIIASGLTTPALRRIVRGATGLLMPSFMEGFGLPIVEALACGTPVIASDLPAHRETGGSDATYLDPADASAWLGAVRDHLDRRKIFREKLRDHRPWTWDDYADRIEPFIHDVWREANAPVALSAKAIAAE